MNRLATLLLATGLLAACGDDKDAISSTQPNVTANNQVVNNSANATSNNATTTNVDPGNNATELPEVRAWTIGQSVLNRPLVVEMYGTEGPVLFLLSSIHGDERLAYTFAERIRTTLLGGLAERNNMRIYFFQIGNPDGVVAGTRQNENGIDLNRNFPADNFDPSAGGGDEPLSEPESIAIYESVGWIDPAAVVTVHCCAPTLDWDGPGEPLAETMAAAMDPAIAFPTVRLGSRAGSFGSLIGVDLDRPIVTVEFSLGNGDDPQLQLESMVSALEAAAVWTTENGELPAMPPEPRIVPEPVTGYEPFTLGRSASGKVLRGDRVGLGGTNYVVSGLDGSGYRGEYVAEHLRTAALFRTGMATRQGVWFVTGASPDAIAFGGAQNADGAEVWGDISSGGTTTPEGRALVDWLGSMEAGTVWWFEDAVAVGSDNRVTVHGPRAGQLSGPLSASAASSLPARYRPVVDAIVDLGHTVVVAEIGEDYFEAEGISESNPDWKPSPTVWSELVLSNL